MLNESFITESFINHKHYSSDFLKERIRMLLLGIDLLSAILRNILPFLTLAKARYYVGWRQPQGIGTSKSRFTRIADERR